MKISTVILAAGKGTRMRSKRPKVLHELLGKPLISYSIETAKQVTGLKPVVIVGYEADAVREVIGDQVDYVQQVPQLGTGHAVQQIEALLREQADLILVLAADMPLLTSDSLKRLVTLQETSGGPITITTFFSQEPRGFGRVVRDAFGDVREIVEQLHATPEILAIRELNAGVYCFDAKWLWEALPRIPLSPRGEYYLTDLVGIAVEDGLPINTFRLEDADEAMGINTRIHLAQAESLLRRKINHKWMLEGVTLVDPQSTYIEAKVKIGMDTIVHPNTYLLGNTTIGDDCLIGPNAIVSDTRIGDRCKVFNSVLESAILEDDVDIGPFGHLRKGAHLAEGVHMGNFGEVKNSYLGAGTKMGHFSYLGDATVGEGVNIGAGTITCNYDGVQKHPTEIGAGAFIGSDTMLVAPLKVGEKARTGAGSVVTKEVPPKTVVAGVPARAIRKIEEDD